MCKSPSCSLANDTIVRWLLWCLHRLVRVALCRTPGTTSSPWLCCCCRGQCPVLRLAAADLSSSTDQESTCLSGFHSRCHSLYSLSRPQGNTDLMPVGCVESHVCLLPCVYSKCRLCKRIVMAITNRSSDLSFGASSPVLHCWKPRCEGCFVAPHAAKYRPCSLCA